MTSVAETIRRLTLESDIPYQSDVYEEISRKLAATRLNVAFFSFTSSSNSSSARRLAGKSERCPVLTLYLKYDADFRQTGIDQRRGNWDDKWALTPTIRNILNGSLERLEFGSDYVSDHTFVFVRTLETHAFRQIGCDCKAAVRELVCAELPEAEVAHIFWNGSQYDVIMQDESGRKRGQAKKTELAQAISGMLAQADKESLCQTYSVALEFGHGDANLFHLRREDIA